MKKAEYTFLRSVDKWIKEDGDIYAVSKNGNIDDSAKIGNIISLPGHWWKNLSPYDNDIVDQIWRNIWEKWKLTVNGLKKKVT